MANTKQVFLPQGSFDHPVDVTLMVEDGREFKAHRTVLSEASPFFEKLLNSEMREANEGVIRLEMVKESYMRVVLEFIYTGSLDISDEDNAKELIAIADYLVIQQLKTRVERVLEKHLNTLNAISIYYYGERYQCTELISVGRKFILANFTTVAKTEEFCALSSKEVIMWISNDELNVNAEEDVFKIILTWINHAKSERKKYFSELFREVRLIYVSRYYLGSDVVRNELVNDNEDCLDLVKDAMNLMDSEYYRDLSVKPRKSLETPVLLVSVKYSRREEQILCYHIDPRAKKFRVEKWCEFPDKLPANTTHVIGCSGKLYVISETENGQLLLCCYDPFSNCWTSLPYEGQRIVCNVFVRNEEEIYALVSVDKMISPDGMFSMFSMRSGRKTLTKYNPQRNSWKDIASLDLASRIMICVVAKDNFIYFIGGRDQEARYDLNTRYDFNTNTCCRIADLKVPRLDACGAAAYGKIFISSKTYELYRGDSAPPIEVYDETTDEWQLIRGGEWVPSDGFSPPRSGFLLGMVCVEGKLYVLNCLPNGCMPPHCCRQIACYDNDEWKEISRIENYSITTVGTMMFLCSTAVFKGSKFLQQAMIFDAFPRRIVTAEDQSKSCCKRRCAVM